MAVNLVKGQKIDLTKGNPGLSKITVGLGWDPNTETKGLLGGLFGKKQTIDCDASALLIDSNKKCMETIYFGHLKNKNNSIVHTGDNLTGDGDGDDEQILVDLNQVPNTVEKLVFIVNIYNAQSKKQHFGMIKNAYIRIVDNSNNKELIRYSLTDNYSNKTGLFTGEIYRHNNEWKFMAIGEGTLDTSVSEMVKRYR